MEEESFKPEDLKLLDWQYTVIHHDTSSFKVGDQVFLKSNPEFPMTVVAIAHGEVFTTWVNALGAPMKWHWKPQLILQYRYACFVTGRRKFHLCLN